MPIELLPSLFYDDTCGFCSKGVLWLAGAPAPRGIRAVGLTCPAGQALLCRRPELREARSVIWCQTLPGGIEQVLIRSDAVLAALARRGGAWALAGMFTAVPRPLRDGIYLWFAARRHRFARSGPDESCPVPRPPD